MSFHFPSGLTGKFQHAQAEKEPEPWVKCWEIFVLVLKRAVLVGSGPEWYFNQNNLFFLVFFQHSPIPRLFTSWIYTAEAWKRPIYLNFSNNCPRKRERLVYIFVTPHPPPPLTSQLNYNWIFFPFTSSLPHHQTHIDWAYSKMTVTKSSFVVMTF